TAGGYLCQWAQWLTGVGADKEFHLLQPVRGMLALGAGFESDAEFAPWHPQPLNLRLYRGGQRFGCLLPNATKLARLFLVVAGVGRQLFAKTFQSLVIGIEAFQFFEQALLERRQLGWLHAMFARQGIDAVQALFQGLLALRVGVEMVQKAVQLADRFFYLDL